MQNFETEFNTSPTMDFQTEFQSVVASALKEEKQEKTVELVENGNFKVEPDEGKVLSSVDVNVNVPLRYEEGYEDGYQASQDSITLQEKTITENGEFVTDEGFTGMSKVNVAVPIKEEQEKTVEITKNGTTEVVADEGKSMSKVTVKTNVAFEGDIGKPYLDTSKITDFQYFCCYNRLNDYLDKLDTSNGTNFSYMFQSCGILASIPLLNTSKGTNFYYMFSGCAVLETIPPLDTSNGKNFSYMFQNCTTLTTIPTLDISNGTGFNNTFQYCYKLETVSLTTAKSNLSTSTFSGCSALKNITIGEGWAVNIYLHYSNNLTVESLHGMIENLADLTGQTAKTFQIGATNLAKIDEEHLTMLNNKNWNYS